MTEVEEFFRVSIPGRWFTGPARIDEDGDEIVCVGVLPPGALVEEFRESSRPERVAIAAEAESRFGRKVSWGVERDGRTRMFTSVSLPVMTRLRLPERSVLDTLISGGVARSRSEALAWCVKLVGRHQAEWLADLRGAVAEVRTVRDEGPALI
jgi:hypothetical protein